MRNTATMNLSLLSKLASRIMANPHSLLAKLLWPNVKKTRDGGTTPLSTMPQNFEGQ